MSTAIILAGHMRSFDRCLANQHWFVFRHYPDAHFFVMTEPDEDGNKAELLDMHYPGRVEIEYRAQPDMDEPLANLGFSHPWVYGQFYTHEPNFISVPPQAVLGQLWRLNEALKAWSEIESYTTVIRMRPDLYFHRFEKPALRSPFSVMSPWWGRFGGINDRLAVMRGDMAKHYFGTYDNIPPLLASGCPLHPESLVRASVEAGGGVHCPWLRAEFSTMRNNGDMRGPEISAGDIADVALQLASSALVT